MLALALALAWEGGAASAVMGPAPAPPARPHDTQWQWDAEPPTAWPGAGRAPVLTHQLLQDERLTVRAAQGRGRGQGPDVIPVVHVQLSTLAPPRDLARHHAQLRTAVLEAAALSRSGWVQLDLEARPSQREAWRALVADLRRSLPPDIGLSVTALAWWCRSGAWLDGLPADEVVPMFFRMGADGPALRRILQDRPEALHPRCRSGAAGFSRAEPLPAAVTGRYAQRYWFDPGHGRGGSWGFDHSADPSGVGSGHGR